MINFYQGEELYFFLRKNQLLKMFSIVVSTMKVFRLFSNLCDNFCLGNPEVLIGHNF